MICPWCELRLCADGSDPGVVAEELDYHLRVLPVGTVDRPSSACPVVFEERVSKLAKGVCDGC